MDVKKVVSELTLEEKAGLLSGKDFWRLKSVPEKGVPEVMVSDGPHGLRKQAEGGDHLGINESIVATCFPTSVGVAASFDRELARRQGECLGREAAAEKLAVLLGPAINIKRSPLCGRNFEYMSEDPFLTGELAAAYIDGVQSNGVGVSVKHFAANNQEGRRMTISAETDERTLREIYLPGFENAVKKSAPWTIMCSYNRINGVYSSENEWLLTKVLRDEWGFKGLVMTDWGAVHDRVEGVKAGLELEMPSSGGKNDRKIVEAVRSGALDEKKVDEAAELVLKLIDESTKKNTDIVYDRDLDHEKAVDIAADCMVLLKNDGILPLDKSKKYAFIGEFAKKPRHQGGGSSHINTTRVKGAWDAAAGIEKVFARGYRDRDEEDASLIAEAVAAAKSADVAIVFAGLTDAYESEGFDRRVINMPKNHNALIEAVAAANPETVVVLHNGAPVAMPWLDKVKGVLEAYLGGEAAGEAEARILFGDVNPSAKLPETFPHSLGDAAADGYFPGGVRAVHYKEGLYVGYRWYDKSNVPVLFPFGYGLSYTSFEYSDLKIEDPEVDILDKPLTISFNITNTGKVFGKEIAEVYVADKESTAYRPVKELKGFEKVALEAGETKRVTITLDKRAFAFWNSNEGAWQVESGDFDILVGASSADIRLKATVTLSGDAEDIPNDRERLPHYYSGDVKNVPDDEFERLLGHKPMPLNAPEGAKLDMSATFEDAKNAGSGLGRFVNWLLPRVMKDTGLGNKDVMVSIIMQTPVHAMVNMSGGLLSEEMGAALVDLFNREHRLRAFGRILKGVFTMGKRAKLAKENKL